MEANEFKKALAEVLDSLEIKVDLTGTLSFNIKDNDLPEPEPSIGPPIDPEPSTGPPVDPPTSNTLFTQDFVESPLTQAYKVPDAQRDFGRTHYSNGLTAGNYNVLIEEEDGNRYMRVKTRKDEFGANAGLQVNKYLDDLEREEMYLSYNIMFRPNFESVIGGKLPGLMGGPLLGPGLGGANGFTCRWMFKEECSVDFYLYWPEMPGKYGSHFGRFPDPETGEQFSFKSDTNVWHNFTTRVKLNSSGSHNGFIEAYIDGKCVSLVDRLLLRTTTTIKIEELSISHFFGGGSDQWAPPYDQWIRLDDFHLFEIEESAGQLSELGRDISGSLLNWPKT
jgi:hypothetical protein